jgi:hypothetical protein
VEGESCRAQWHPVDPEDVRELMVKPAVDASKPQETTDPKDWDEYVLEGDRFYVVQTSPQQVQLNCHGVVELEILIVR